MSDAVRDAIATSLAGLTRVNATPVAPFGYGSDVSCAQDVDAGVAELDGFDTLVLGQAIVRRLDTPRGSLPDDPSYGISLRDMLNVGVSAGDVASLAGVIRNEVRKDERIESVVVTVTPSAGLDALTVTLRVVTADVGSPFEMVLAVTSSGVLLEAIG